MPEETLLAFDFGAKRIGVATGNRLLGQAQALTTVAAESNTERFRLIDALIKEWQPSRLLVGRPAHEDGRPHDMTARCERFARQLQSRYHLPVEPVDERFSSQEAERGLKATGMDWRQRKARIDTEAARILLQDWLDAHAGPSPAKVHHAA